MYIITSDDKTPGVRTFRCQSDSDTGTYYTVKRIRRPPSVRGPVIRNRWLCTCGDFMNRRMLDNSHCKHIKRIRAYIATVGGISHVARGAHLSIADSTVIPKKLVMPKPYVCVICKLNNCPTCHTRTERDRCPCVSKGRFHGRKA